MVFCQTSVFSGEDAFELASQLSAACVPDKQQAGDIQIENTGHWSASRQLQIYKCHTLQTTADALSTLSPLLFFIFQARIYVRR